MRLFCGLRIYLIRIWRDICVQNMIYKETLDRKIIKEFNLNELTIKYRISESYVRAIIRKNKKSV